MMRESCTCNPTLSMCPACLAWDTMQRQRAAKFDGKQRCTTPIVLDGHKTYTRYSRGTIRLVQRLRASGVALDAIAVWVGIPYSTIRRVVRMTLVSAKTAEVALVGEEGGRS